MLLMTSIVTARPSTHVRLQDKAGNLHLYKLQAVNIRGISLVPVGYSSMCVFNKLAFQALFCDIDNSWY